MKKQIKQLNYILIKTNFIGLTPYLRNKYVAKQKNAKNNTHLFIEKLRTKLPLLKVRFFLQKLQVYIVDHYYRHVKPYKMMRLMGLILSGKSQVNVQKFI